MSKISSFISGIDERTLLGVSTIHNLGAPNARSHSSHAASIAQPRRVNARQFLPTLVVVDPGSAVLLRHALVPLDDFHNSDTHNRSCALLGKQGPSPLLYPSLSLA